MLFLLSRYVVILELLRVVDALEAVIFAFLRALYLLNKPTDK